jgi:hypothetical protein
MFILFCKRKTCLTRREGISNGDEARHARLSRPTYDIREINGEGLCREMTVGVDHKESVY